MSKNREKDSSQKAPTLEEQVAAASGRRLMTMDDVPFRFRPQAERIVKLAELKTQNSFYHESLLDKVAQYSRQEHPEKALDCLEEILKNPKLTAAGFDHLYTLLEQFKIPGTEMYAVDLALSIFDSLLKNPSFSRGDFPDALQNLRIIFSVIGGHMGDLEPLGQIIGSKNLVPSILEEISTAVYSSVAPDLIYYLTAAASLLNHKDASDPQFLKKGFALLGQAAREPDWLVISGFCQIMQSEPFNKGILDAIFKPFQDALNKKEFSCAIEDILSHIDQANKMAKLSSREQFSPEETLSAVRLVAGIAMLVDKEKGKEPSASERQLSAIYALTSTMLAPESFRAAKKIYSEIASFNPEDIYRIFDRTLNEAIEKACGVTGQSRNDLFSKILSNYWEGKRIAKNLGADYADSEVCINFAFAISVLGKEKAIILNKEFGIEYFMRYPVEVLNDMYGNRFEKDSGKPLLVVSYNKSDYNGAFYKSRENMVELSKHYRVVITEAGTEGDFYYNLERVSHKYGKIGTLVLGGHGSIDEIRLGKGKEESAGLDFTDEKALSKASMFFTDSPTVVLESCSTGKDQKAIGGLLSKVWGARLFAPKEPTSLSKFIFKKNGEIETVKYVKDEKSEFLKGRIYSKPAL